MLPILISSLDAPDRKAFYTNLYRKYYPMMKRLAYQISRDSSVIDDIIQEVLLCLLKYYDKLRTLNEAYLAGYITLTVKSAAIKFMKKRTRDWSYYGTEADFSENLPDLTTPEQITIQKEKSRELFSVLDCMKESDRDLLLYKYILEKPNSELANMFDTNETNIRKRLERARRLLARIVQSMEGF